MAQLELVAYGSEGSGMRSCRGWGGLLVACVLLGVFGLCVGDDRAAAHIRQVKSNWSLYRRQAQLEATTPRAVELNEVLKRHHGVYQDEARNKRLGLTNTVVLIVQLVQRQKNNFHPKISLLNNMICHLKRHTIMSIVYLSRYLFNNSNTPSVHDHFVPNDNILLIPYPDFSFWNMLVERGKTTSIHAKQTARHSYPNFREYGDKAVLFAVLELMRANLNVILLDDDVMLIRDPIPFLVNNHITADIVTPEDTRKCIFLANPLLDISKWQSMKPEINLGVTFFRSRDANVLFVQRWMNMVEFNGQKAFFPFRRLLQADNSCHTRRKLDTALENTSQTRPEQLSICYLSNTLFQNGYVNSFRCGKFNKNQVYLMTIGEEILSHRDHFAPDNILSKNFSLEVISSAEELDSIRRNNADLHLLTPVTVHPNYEEKELTIKNYLFWIYEVLRTSDGKDNKKCKAFKLIDKWNNKNSMYHHFYSIIQERKREALAFFNKYATAVGRDITCLFYAVEALPSPAVVFRLVRIDDTLKFEAFDVVPNSFRLSAGSKATADVFVRGLERNATAVSVEPVLAIPFSIFGDKNHSLVATFPVHLHSNFWGNSQ